MHAIGNQVIAKFPRKRVVYATSEKFTNEFITTIQQGKIDEFRARYRRIDLLLIDDIQFIADKERTQEEFFHTFNAIHEDGKQIVLSSDRPPKAILTLEERLRSRFEWGLIADLTAPDLETRIAILRAKAEEGAVPITSDVIEFIARKVVSNIRELEGALNRIVAYASAWARCRSASSWPRPSCPTSSTTPRSARSPPSGSPGSCPTTTASRWTRSRARSATRRSSCPARSRCS